MSRARRRKEGGKEIAQGIVSDELWTVIKPSLLVVPLWPRGGRPRVSDRVVVTEILFGSWQIEHEMPSDG
jgi:hypothetical protein